MPVPTRRPDRLASRPVIDGSVCLIVNPHAGGGRALRLLPGVEAALRGQGRPFRVAETMSMQHARELAREACDKGEIVAAMGGDGIVGAVAGELRDGPGPARGPPRRARQRLRAQAGDPVRSGRGGEAAADGEERRIDLAEANGTVYLGILSAGIDSDVNRIALETRLKLGTFVYTYGVLRAIASWRAADVERHGRRRDARLPRLQRRRRQLRRLRRRHVPRPRREPRGRPARRRARSPSQSQGCATCAGSRACSTAATCRTPRSTSSQGREITFSADRPFTAYADGDPIGDLPLTVQGPARLAAGGGAAMIRLAAGVAAAKAVGTLARTAGRGGGTSLPGKVLTKVEPHAIGQPREPPDRRQRRHLRHQRQDDDRGDGRLDPRAHRRAPRPQPRRSEHGRRDRQRPGERVTQGRPRAQRRLRPVRGRRVLARRRSPRSSSRERCCSATCSATSSTATASWRRSPTAGPRSSRTAPGSSSTPTTRWSPTSAATPRSPTYFGVDDDRLALPELQHASDSKHCRRCGHAYTYSAVYLAHLGHYKCPNCGQERPAAHDRRHRRRAQRHQDRRVHAARPPRSSSPSPASTTSTTRSAPPRSRSASASSSTTSSHGLQAVAPAFGRAETLDLGRPTSILLVKNPAGANEVLRTLALEGEQLDLLGVLNDRIADGRDVSWVWDADWELLVGSVRRFTASGTRAAELALRMKYAGLDPSRIHVVDDARTGPRPRPAGRRRPALRRPHLHRAARAAETPHPPRPGGGLLAMTSPSTPSGTTSSAAATTPTCRCGRSSPARPRRHPGRRRRHRPRRAPARQARATTSPRSTSTPSCCDVLEQRARPASKIPTLVADAADFTLDAPVDLIAVPMQTIQLLEARDGFFALGPHAPSSPAAASRSRSPPSSSPTTAPRRSRSPTSAPATAGPTSRSRSRSASRAISAQIERVRQRVGPNDERITPRT